MRLRNNILFAFLMLCIIAPQVSAQPRNAVFTDASELGLLGKLYPDTPNPYHRADTTVFNDFTKAEKRILLSSAGLSVAFKTNSRYLGVMVKYGYKNYGVNTMGMALRGFDLYIKKDGKWVFAACKCKEPKEEDGFIELISNMEEGTKECLLYLPMYSEILSLELVTLKGASIEPLKDAFRGNVAIWGSSFTQGIGASRSGMGYVQQFSRNTGINMLSLGTNGSCKLQDNFTDVLVNAPYFDALILDAFSNPEPVEIQERLFPFIEKIQASHPGVPIIFQQTIYRERRNFDTWHDSAERSKYALTEQLMEEACKRYKDVYFVHPTATDEAHDTSVDGAHPDDHGHSIWAKSLEKQVVKILKKYGI